MPKSHRLPLLSAVLPLLLSLPAAATTYTLVSDSDLAAQAPAIAEVTVESFDISPAAGMPATDYLVSVERVLQGDLPGSNLIVRVPGGQRPSGMALKIYGAPEFVPGDRAILFLKANGDGSFHILHLMLGAFREVREGATWIAERNLSAAERVEIPGKSAAGPEPVRDLNKFRDWLADRAMGIVRAPDYVVPMSHQAKSNASEPATFFNNRGTRLRWFEFDSNQSVAFRANAAGQPGVPDSGFSEFQAGLNAWNNAAATNIRYSYAGTTSSTAGLDDFDDINAILFNTAIQGDDFSCDSGGVLAIGGPWYDPTDRGTFHGETFIRIGGADIVVNAGLECFFERSRSPSQAAAELFTHELGHTLGLGHSCGDQAAGSCFGHPELSDAIMRANIHDDGRGARLGSDDLAGIQQLYGTGGTTGGHGPAVPGNVRLTVSGRSIRIDWQDRSSNERGFRIYRGTSSSNLALIATLAPNVHTYTDANLAASTRYFYQVSSFNNRGETRSGTVNARTGH